jgi:hypothetical protein
VFLVRGFLFFGCNSFSLLSQASSTGLPRPVKVTLPGAPDNRGRGESYGYYGLRRVKNRPDARDRSAAANPIRQPGALGTIFALPAQTPGVYCPWGFAF